MPDVTLYGIANCDAVKKTRKWLDQHEIPYDFHDYKKSGVSVDALQQWLDILGPDIVINKRGTTWRKLDELQKEMATDVEQRVNLLVDNSSLIKRPIVSGRGALFAGFDEQKLEALLGR